MTFAAATHGITLPERCEGAGHATRPHHFPRASSQARHLCAPVTSPRPARTSVSPNRADFARFTARQLARAVILLGGACLFSSATAQEVTVTEPAGAIAVIHIYNDWTAGSADGVINVETPRGTVSLRYESTPNGCGPECAADVVDVVAWPEGTLPDAVTIRIEELATGTIVLREWAGM